MEGFIYIVKNSFSHEKELKISPVIFGYLIQWSMAMGRLDAFMTSHLIKNYSKLLVSKLQSSK